MHLGYSSSMTRIVPQNLLARAAREHRNIITYELVVLLDTYPKRLSSVVVQTADLAVLDDVHDVVQTQILVHDHVEGHE